MHLSPRERADFDEIVARLRIEEAGDGAVTHRHQSMGLLGALVLMLVVFIPGLALLVERPEIFAPLMVATVMFGCVLIARRRRHPRSA
ncbi:MAG TPA: hypothetical protein VL595_22080 [Pseudonocardia sp.]|jgi:hypothetical protein|nr:hypothetical protein [Pseudonocardia sp.]